MRRMLIVVTTLALTLVLMGGLWPADDRHGSDGGLAAVRSPLGLESRTAEASFRISVPFSLADPVTVRHNDRQLFYRGHVGCTEGEQLRMRITVAQGDAEGHGQLVERCTGELEEFEVRVVVRGPHTFAVGDHADYWGWAGTFSRGTMTDEHVWEGTTTLLPEESDGPGRRIG